MDVSREEIIVTNVMEARLVGKGSRGRPRITWMDTVVEYGVRRGETTDK